MITFLTRHGIAVLALLVAVGAWVMSPQQVPLSALLNNGAQQDTNIQLAADAPRPGLAQLFGNNPTIIADVAEKVANGVVNIDVSRTERVQSYLPGMSPFSDEMFKRFFGFGGPNGPGQGERVITGNGSGAVIDAAGYIMTNNHVVHGADEVQVTLNDGRKYPAKVIGTDPYTDLAVVKIDAPNLQPVPFGDSDVLRPGEFVLAIGSPLGFDHTVTLGIVSASSRKVPDINMNMEFIQTDAAINPGNSGGPLVNLNGQIVGINTAISGRAQNIGFAIPANVVKTVSESLIASGTIKRPYIGIAMAPLNPELAKSMGLSERTEGIVVAQVIPESPADRAGFITGDVIQRMNGDKVTNAKDVQKQIQSMSIGTEVNFQILRDNRLMAMQLTSEELPKQPAKHPPIRRR